MKDLSCLTPQRTIDSNTSTKPTDLPLLWLLTFSIHKYLIGYRLGYWGSIISNTERDKRFSVLQSIWTGSVSHPVPSSYLTEGSFPGDKADRLRRPHTSIFRDYESVESYYNSSIRLHAEQWDNLICTFIDWRVISGVPRGVWGVQTPPPRNSEGPPKSC